MKVALLEAGEPLVPQTQTSFIRKCDSDEALHYMIISNMVPDLVPKLLGVYECVKETQESFRLELDSGSKVRKTLRETLIDPNVDLTSLTAGLQIFLNNIQAVHSQNILKRYPGYVLGPSICESNVYVDETGHFYLISLNHILVPAKKTRKVTYARDFAEFAASVACQPTSPKAREWIDATFLGMVFLAASKDDSHEYERIKDEKCKTYSKQRFDTLIEDNNSSLTVWGAALGMAATLYFVFSSNDR